jgi:SAM-dependent methyltransferase
MTFFVPKQAAVLDPPGPVVEWEEVACNLCGSDDWSPLVEAPDQAPGGTGLWFAVVQCQRCGLCFTNPRPNEASIAQFYPPEYKPHRSKGEDCKSQNANCKLGIGGYGQKGLHIPWQGQGRLLDFGCGSGRFLERMRRRGWKVTGLDTSALAVHRVQSNLGLPVLLGSLPHSELEPESFDVVTMWQSLEHVHDPRAVLRETNKLLVDGGKLFITTPNIDSLAFRWFGPAWYGLDLPRHLTHFTPTTLQVMLERAGFRVQEVRMVRHSSWLRASARLTSRFPFKSSWRRWLSRKPVSRLATWYSYWTRQADCILATAVK